MDPIRIDKTPQYNKPIKWYVKWEHKYIYLRMNGKSKKWVRLLLTGWWGWSELCQTWREKPRIVVWPQWVRSLEGVSCRLPWLVVIWAWGLGGGRPPPPQTGKPSGCATSLACAESQQQKPGILGSILDAGAVFEHQGALYLIVGGQHPLR